MAQSSVMAIRGVTGLLRAFREMPDVLQDVLGKHIAVTTVSVAQRMRAAAPRRTGLLQSSIHTSTRGLKGRVLIGADAFYWPFIEFGTVKLPANPFIRSSAEMSSNEFEDGLRRVSKDLERSFEQKAT